VFRKDLAIRNISLSGNDANEEMLVKYQVKMELCDVGINEIPHSNVSSSSIGCFHNNLFI
jgi:hypothetical protein